MQEIVSIINDIGFPIFVAIFLLVKIAPVISKNTEAINLLREIVTKLDEKG